MRVYTFHLRKGGDAKTSLTGNVAYGLAKRGLKTVMVDVDGQANLTDWMVGDGGKYELADIFEEVCNVEEALVPITDNLYLIGTARENSDLPVWEKVKLNDKIFVFRALIRKLKKLGFDLVFFDLPPTFLTLQSRVYLAVDEVIAATTPTKFSEDGLMKLAGDIEETNTNFEVGVTCQKLVMSNVNLSKKRHRTRKEALLELTNEGYQVFIVPTASAVEAAQESMDYGPGTTVYSQQVTEESKTKALEAYEKIVDAIEKEVRE